VEVSLLGVSMDDVLMLPFLSLLFLLSPERRCWWCRSLKFV